MENVRLLLPKNGASNWRSDLPTTQTLAHPRTNTELKSYQKRKTKNRTDAAPDCTSSIRSTRIPEATMRRTPPTARSDRRRQSYAHHQAANRSVSGAMPADKKRVHRCQRIQVYSMAAAACSSETEMDRRAEIGRNGLGSTSAPSPLSPKPAWIDKSTGDHVLNPPTANRIGSQQSVLLYSTAILSTSESSRRRVPLHRSTLI